MDKKYTLSGQPFTVVTVTKPGKFPVVGHFSDGSLMSLMADGTSNYGSALIEVSPYSDFVIDQKVMVRDFDEDEWERRHFAGCREDGMPQTFFRKASSWTAKGLINEWHQCRRPTKEELAE